MKRPFSLGDLVGFQLVTGQASEGIIIHRIVEKRQPVIYLIESADKRRAFRFETELSLVTPAEAMPRADESDGDPHIPTPVFAAQTADD